MRFSNALLRISLFSFILTAMTGLSCQPPSTSNPNTTSLIIGERAVYCYSLEEKIGFFYAPPSKPIKHSSSGFEETGNLLTFVNHLEFADGETWNLRVETEDGEFMTAILNGRRFPIVGGNLLITPPESSGQVVQVMLADTTSASETSFREAIKRIPSIMKYFSGRSEE